MITRKNFLPTLCVVYTIIVLTKLILEAVLGHTDTYYTQNLLFMFVISFAAVSVLSLQSFLQDIPLLFIIIGQYLLVIAFAEGGIWFTSLFDPVNPEGYLEIFISVSVPYGIGATIYYIEYFKKIKKINLLLQKIQNRDTGHFSEQ